MTPRHDRAAASVRATSMPTATIISHGGAKPDKLETAEFLFDLPPPCFGSLGIWTTGRVGSKRGSDRENLSAALRALMLVTATDLQELGSALG